MFLCELSPTMIGTVLLYPLLSVTSFDVDCRVHRFMLSCLTAMDSGMLRKPLQTFGTCTSNAVKRTRNWQTAFPSPKA